jgi:hypothetical protein
MAAFAEIGNNTKRVIYRSAFFSSDGIRMKSSSTEEIVK